MKFQLVGRTRKEGYLSYESAHLTWDELQEQQEKWKEIIQNDKYIFNIRRVE